MSSSPIGELRISSEKRMASVIVKSFTESGFRFLIVTFFVFVFYVAMLAILFMPIGKFLC